jgi:hypothetical protein
MIIGTDDHDPLGNLDHGQTGISTHDALELVITINRNTQQRANDTNGPAKLRSAIPRKKGLTKHPNLLYKFA